MRLFTGIPIAPHVVESLARTIATLRTAAQVRWSPVENFHITTKFIGEWPESRLSEIEQALSAIDPPGAFGISIARFGFSPNPRRPRTLFAGVHAGAALAELARKTEDALAAIGCEREERAYSPHLTVARIGKDHNVRALRERIAALADFEFGSFEAAAFHLYLSKPGRGGSAYTALAAYSLAKETRAA